jgi:hypothetical protein
MYVVHSLICSDNLSRLAFVVQESISGFLRKIPMHPPQIAETTPIHAATGRFKHLNSNPKRHQDPDLDYPVLATLRAEKYQDG